ncbi:hypothetical protein CC1G_13909 [Coprinopsis cinerea okayama7|uniref:Uncharacterized protein n=1 Tax=Coprinopsis cinerea (strain Okayama-7 / 130 / ATCC MYA-4618 / FGSC 9003) TaxID=240176 RepID=D6RKX7_COPC7|nr:hypothetical protein CC1G_13909 [Coprinopsis cinerea okayama7\|eukprot:XP_002911869.1 hypothetical protein CC1G_13909 [Coprinopsis cinerea okayama7\
MSAGYPKYRGRPEPFQYATPPIRRHPTERKAQRGRSRLESFFQLDPTPFAARIRYTQ